MEEDLLSGYRQISSFALWDGEHAVLRFTGKIDQDFVKTDSKGVEQHYRGVHVFLLEHSNENYNHLVNTETIMRIGIDSTLDKWLKGGGLKGMSKDKTFRVDMSKALGYGLRIES